MAGRVLTDSDPCNPCTVVRETSAWVLHRASQVSINDSELLRFAAEYSEERVSSLRKEVEWDACDWHYKDADTDLTAQYIFVMDSLNYCFWPVEGLEYEQLATSLRDVLQRDPHAFDACSLKTLTAAQLQAWFPTHTLPDINGRVERLRELGWVLEKDFDGRASKMAAAAQGSAVQLVRLVIEKLQGFRDTVVHKGRLVHFYKRAQILVSDLWAAYGRQMGESSHFAAFADMHELTMFADYRVPQILRYKGILTYAPELAAQIDSKAPLDFGCDAETEIRAATVVAVDRIRDAIQKAGVNILTVEVDWLLWNAGEVSLDLMEPHHRTHTIYY